MFKVIIAGGRDFRNYDYLKECCNKALSNQTDIQIVCGMAKGADLLGFRYAKERNYSIAEFPADWTNLDVEPCVVKTNSKGEKYNSLAGMSRNKMMSENSDALIAFWNGSSGTKNMIDLAAKRGLKIKNYKY